MFHASPPSTRLPPNPTRVDTPHHLPLYYAPLEVHPERSLAMSNGSLIGPSFLSLTLWAAAACAEAPPVEERQSPMPSNITNRDIENLPTGRRPIMQLLQQPPLGPALDKA